MKTRISTFAAGFICAMLISALSVTALAASGTINLTVHNINIKVNGEVFQPKDVNGNNVMVFAYNGTTYAPLRALAEAYGLEVGYDAKANLAEVGKPGTVASNKPSSSNFTYEEFKTMWDAYPAEPGEDGIARHEIYYNGSMTLDELKVFWKSLGADTIKEYVMRYVKEELPSGRCAAPFYATRPISNVLAYGSDSSCTTFDSSGTAFDWMRK